MAANEHIWSKADNWKASPRLLSPPELFVRQLVNNGTFFHSTLCTHDCSPPHLENVIVVTCVECGFVSHFIGGKVWHSNFFSILNCAFWKQVAIGHTHPQTNTFSWGGDSGFHVNTRQSHDIKPSQMRYNHFASNQS